MVTDEMVEKAVEAAFTTDVIPLNDPEFPAPKWAGVRIDDYLKYSPEDAVELGVKLTQKTEDGKPRWHWYSDIRGDEQEDAVKAILRPVIRAALEAALSAAEPWPFERQNYNCPCIHPSQCDESCVKKPAPSVAVKALEWREDRTAKYLGATWMVWPYSDPLNDGLGNWLWQVVDAHPHASGRFHTEQEAKAAAQADFEARILSALSAQVQDVAGTEAIAALKEAEPYVEICHSLMTQKETRANVWRVLKQVRAAIAAAPAKQEG